VQTSYHEGQPPASDAVDTLLDERSLSRLKWGCRRGLLENDLFIERFFRRHESDLSVRQARGLQCLMDLSDNDLLDLLLGRSELPRELDRPEVAEVLHLLRKPAPVNTSEGIAP
jgi:antitoxin CptB